MGTAIEDLEAVWNLTGAEDEVTGPAGKLLVAQTETDLPVQDVEGFILAMVHVQRRGRACQEGRLEQPQRARSVLLSALDLEEVALPPDRFRPGLDDGAHVHCLLLDSGD